MLTIGKTAEQKGRKKEGGRERERVKGGKEAEG